MNIIKETYSVFKQHIILIFLITISVWLPVNLLINYLVDYPMTYASSSNIMTILSNLGVFFRPISSGAILYLVYKSKIGEEVSYSQAMKIGFRKWLPLIIASIIPTIIIGLTSILLFIPGIYFAIKYSFIDSLVVIEDKHFDTPRQDSFELTTWKEWEILGTTALFLVINYLLALGLGHGIAYVLEFLNIHIVGFERILFYSLTNIIVDVQFSMLTISLFLIYWNKKKELMEMESFEVLLCDDDNLNESDEENPNE